MHQPIDTFVNAHKDTKVCHIADGTFDHTSDGIFFFRFLPRVRHHLFEPERDPPMTGIHIENYHLDILADLEELRGVSNLSRPRHFGDMNQPFDTAFQFNKRAVIHQADDLTLDPGTYRVFFRHRLPRVRGQLFHAERNSLLLRIKLQYNDFDLVSHLDDFGGMADTTPGHIADMKDAIDTSQINKGSVPRDILHGSFKNNPFLQNLENLLLERIALLFQQSAARNHDVAAGAIVL